jgi:hypothetical protein
MSVCEMSCREGQAVNSSPCGRAKGLDRTAGFLTHSTWSSDIRRVLRRDWNDPREWSKCCRSIKHGVAKYSLRAVARATAVVAVRPIQARSIWEALCCVLVVVVVVVVGC